MSNFLRNNLLKVEDWPDSLALPLRLKSWITLLTENISKRRHELDIDSNKQGSIINDAIKLDILNIYAPENLGGLNLDQKQLHYYFRALARTSGALAFLLTQHVTSLQLILSGFNEQLKFDFLVNKPFEKNLFAVAFAHLREISNPPVIATETSNEFVVNGILRYVTGYKLFNKLLLGFVVANKEYFAITNFTQSETFQISNQLNLVAANSTNTISGKLINHKIPKNMLVSENPLGTLLNNSGKRGRNIASFNIGLALAVLDLITHSKYMDLELIHSTYNELIKQLLAIELELIYSNPTESIINLRIKINTLLSRVFLFGDQIFKGAATINTHPYLLIKKEFQIFTSLASSQETLEQTCKSIINI